MELTNKTRYFTEIEECFEYLLETDKLIENAKHRGFYFKYKYEIFVGEDNYVLNITFAK